MKLEGQDPRGIAPPFRLTSRKRAETAPAR